MNLLKDAMVGLGEKLSDGTKAIGELGESALGGISSGLAISENRPNTNEYGDEDALNTSYQNLKRLDNGEMNGTDGYDWYGAFTKDDYDPVTIRMRSSEVTDWKRFNREYLLFKDDACAKCENIVTVEKVFTLRTGGVAMVTSESFDCTLQQLISERASQIGAESQMDLVEHDKIVSNAAFCVLNVVSHLTDHGVAHRDLKARYFVSNSQFTKENRSWKLSDLRMHKKWGSCASTVKKAQNQVSYFRTSNDQVQSAVILYILLCGGYPFPGVRESSNCQEYGIPKLEILPGWAGSTEGAKQIISGLLSNDEASRISAKVALQNDWIPKPRNYQLPLTDEVDADGMCTNRDCSWYTFKPQSKEEMNTYNLEAEIHYGDHKAQFDATPVKDAEATIEASVHERAEDPDNSTAPDTAAEMPPTATEAAD